MDISNYYNYTYLSLVSKSSKITEQIWKRKWFSKDYEDYKKIVLILIPRIKKKLSKNHQFTFRLKSNKQ